MKNGTVTEQDVKVNIPLLFKVNADKREVEGIVTQEVVDVHGEVVDHESMKTVLANWPGNIREMHQPKAVGKAIKVVSDDDSKATIVRSRISKGAPDTWEKVLDETLSMYSIGGSGKRVTKKTAGGADEVRIYMTALHEISLVDNGACPTAKFEMVKSVDGQSIECQPEEPVDPPPASRAALLALLTKAVAAGGLKTPLTTGAAQRAVVKLEAIPEDRVVKGGYPECYDISSALQAINCLESLMASEWYEAREEAVAGDPEATTAQAQLQMLRQAINLVIQFLVSEFDEQFSDFDEADEDPADGAADLAAALVVENAARRTRIAELVTKFVAEHGALTVEKKGARHNKTDASTIQGMHDSSVALGATCNAPEEKMAAAVHIDGKTVAKTVTEIPAAAIPAKLEKVGSKDILDPVVEPITETTVSKLVTAAVAEALKVNEATHEKAIADLKAQVDKLSGTPRSGGPIARAVAVEKTLAGNTTKAAEGGAGAESDDVLKAFDTLAAAAASPDARLQLASQKLEFMRNRGLGRLDPISGKSVE